MKKNCSIPTAKQSSQKASKLSYEDLETAAHQLSEQARQLYTQNQQLQKALQEADLVNFYKRLDYLWQILTSNIPNEFISNEFKSTCGKEFMKLMSSPEEVPFEDGKDGDQGKTEEN